MIPVFSRPGFAPGWGPAQADFGQGRLWLRPPFRRPDPPEEISCIHYAFNVRKTRRRAQLLARAIRLYSISASTTGRTGLPGVSRIGACLPALFGQTVSRHLRRSRLPPPRFSRGRDAAAAAENVGPQADSAHDATFRPGSGRETIVAWLRRTLSERPRDRA